MNKSHQELVALIHDCLDGHANEEQASRLNTILRTDAAARDLYLQVADVHSCLAVDEGLWGGTSTAAISVESPRMTSRQRWLQWRPLAAAAAGLMFGIFSASLVFGYVVPSLKTRIELFSDSFESGVKPTVDGQPLDAGRWGGDHTEVTGAVGRVTAEDGTHMLRFVRADYAGHHLPESFSSDSFQLLDVRPYKKEFADGTAVVRLSALFNGEFNDVDGPFSCVLKLYALNAELVAERKAGAFTGSISERMLANSSGTRVRLDASPDTWQQAGNELRLPPGTDYLMIQVGMSNDSKRADVRKDAFTAHFVDRVQVVLAHVPEVSSP